ncbi:uncharacterized protein N7498_000044 [Penicillium cinerascens]|uniref:Glycosyltransferase family 25 protein n=1 Tax=Penicillium cinerascens TaxID=70096 RepID=A0A9W9NDN8_9EURO|nr:uncharacterized protein N7498_000044 [Penicillium cinerascens]KAJ5217945.1 hypothetical protein N7498_000044 [Penicillium cinerascens]
MSWMTSVLLTLEIDFLQFEHVYAIGFKGRTDKRDFLTLAASVTGFKVEWIEGVKPGGLLQKAMPNGVNLEDTEPSIIAAWRAHMNALISVIENDHSTALIFEDDADWDVNIKSQLREFARGLHALQSNDKVSKEAPYGTNWDVLWIGGCGTGPDKNQTRFYVIPDDPTNPPSQAQSTLGGPLRAWTEKFPQDSTRFIFRAESGLCTIGYAITRRGAQKILAALSIDHLGQPFDNALSTLCGGVGDRQRIECYAPFPQLFNTHRRAGSSSRDSQIVTNGDESWHDEQSFALVYSTKRNIHRLVAGEETVYSQYSDMPWSQEELYMKQFVHPKGYLVT